MSKEFNTLVTKPVRRVLKATRESPRRDMCPWRKLKWLRTHSQNQEKLCGRVGGKGSVAPSQRWGTQGVEPRTQQLSPLPSRRLGSECRCLSSLEVEKEFAQRCLCPFTITKCWNQPTWKPPGVPRQAHSHPGWGDLKQNRWVEHG